MCDRVVNTYSPTIKNFPECFIIYSTPNQYKTQKMYDKAVDDSLAAFPIVYS